MIGDTPTIASTFYNATTTGLGVFGQTQNDSHNWDGLRQQGDIHQRAAQALAKQALFRNVSHPQSIPSLEIPMTATRRLVKVIIVDPNENIPLDQCLLYSGEEKLTDATDQELFFEIDIKDILAKHNEKRVKVVDKKVKERTEFLEPAKIRDLKMAVVNVANF